MLHTSFASAAPRGMPFSQMVNRKFGAFVVKPSSNFYANCLTTPSLATHLISFFIITFVLVSSAITINQLPPLQLTMSSRLIQPPFLPGSCTFSSGIEVQQLFLVHCLFYFLFFSPTWCTVQLLKYDSLE